MTSIRHSTRNCIYANKRAVETNSSFQMCITTSRGKNTSNKALGTYFIYQRYKKMDIKSFINNTNTLEEYFVGYLLPVSL